ncbi:MAG TPA: hypothetical protein VGR61_06800 [Candidatus Dormibacteraeota bacterium]|nr:hypothetical protein [Candidatus Dormibacteraeota bacterium]
MQCPECLKEQLPARYCVSCGARMAPNSTEPDPLDMVPEHPGIPTNAGSSGTFAYGRDRPAGMTLVPSDWTYPMRQAVTAWLVFSGVFDLYFVLRMQDAIRQAAYPTGRVARGELSATEALASAQTAFDVVLGGLVIWLLIKALLAAGAYSGRTAWVFYACMGIVGMNALLGLLSLATLAVDLGRRQDATQPLVSLFVQATAAALLVWMALGLQRYGPWASTQVPSASA